MTLWASAAVRLEKAMLSNIAAPAVNRTTSWRIWSSKCGGSGLSRSSSTGQASGQIPRLGSTLTMRFRIQFLDRSARVIRQLFADARNAAGATALVADIDWPPRAITMRVLDLDGREVHSAFRGDAKS
jgi:hypothetical protein